MGFTITAEELMQFLKQQGFIAGKGGRHQVHMVKGKLSIPIPAHKEDMKKGTAKGILKMAGFTIEDVMRWRG